MKQVKILNKVTNKEETVIDGKVGEKVFAIVNNVKETSDAMSWCNQHEVGDTFECDEYKIEIIREI